MKADEKIALMQAILSGETLLIDIAGIVVPPAMAGEHAVYIAMLGKDGKRYNVPLSSDLALRLGEQLVRAADAINDGVALTQT